MTNLADEVPIQLELPFKPGRELDGTLDRLRERFGDRAVTRAVLLGRDQGPAVPLLDD